jgi:hypothetical protein
MAAEIFPGRAILRNVSRRIPIIVVLSLAVRFVSALGANRATLVSTALDFRNIAVDGVPNVGVTARIVAGPAGLLEV